MSTNLHNRLKLIREGAVLGPNGSDTLDGYDRLSLSLSNPTSQIDKSMFFEMVEGITDMHMDPALLWEASSSLVAINTYAARIIKFIKEKIAKLFMWIKIKSGLFRSQRLQNIRASKKRILAYTGSHILPIPEKLFTFAINLNQLESSIEDSLDVIDQVERAGDAGLNKYAGLMIYKDNPKHINYKMFSQLVANTFGVPEAMVLHRDIFFDHVCGRVVDTNIGTINPKLVLDKIDSFDSLVTTINGISGVITARLTKFERDNNVHKINNPDDITLLLKFMVALIEGLLNGTHRIFSVMLFAYHHVLKIAEVMAGNGTTQAQDM